MSFDEWLANVVRVAAENYGMPNFTADVNEMRAKYEAGYSSDDVLEDY